MAEKTSEAIQDVKKVEAELKQDEVRRQQEEKKAEAKPEAKAAAEPAEKKVEKKLVLDRVLVAPLSKAFRKPRSARAKTAVSLLKQFVARHAKTPVESVRVDAELNSAVQSSGARNPPKKVRVRVAKDEQGIASVSLAK